MTEQQYADDVPGDLPFDGSDFHVVEPSADGHVVHAPLGFPGSDPSSWNASDVLAMVSPEHSPSEIADAAVDAVLVDSVDPRHFASLPADADGVPVLVSLERREMTTMLDAGMEPDFRGLRSLRSVVLQDDPARSVECLMDLLDEEDLVSGNLRTSAHAESLSASLQYRYPGVGLAEFSALRGEVDSMIRELRDSGEEDAYVAKRCLEHISSFYQSHASEREPGSSYEDGEEAGVTDSVSAGQAGAEQE